MDSNESGRAAPLSRLTASKVWGHASLAWSLSAPRSSTLCSRICE